MISGRSAKRIVLACFGSLGDLYPYIAIAKALLRRGQRPVIATMDRYRDAVTAEAIEFAPMRPSAAQMGDFAAAVRRILAPLRGPEILIREFVLPHLRESYEDLLRAAEGADLIVSHPLAFAAPLIAEKRGLPWASTVLSPLSMMSAIDPGLLAALPWLNWVRRLGIAPYRFMFGLLKLAVAHWEAPLREFRAELGLPATKKAALFEGQYSPALNLALFPSVLASPQADWPPNTHTCGFARYDGRPMDTHTKTDLESFLAAGAPPVVFTLGSSVALHSQGFLAKAVEAAMRLNRRAIVILPSPQDTASMEGGRIIRFASLPYSAVFPHAAVNVHAGGIGTLAQALAAGRPQLVLPAAFDQPDNARRAARLGVARALAFRRTTPDALVSALSDLLGDPDYASKARAVAAPAAADGASRAADLLNEFA